MMARDFLGAVRVNGWLFCRRVLCEVWYNVQVFAAGAVPGIAPDAAVVDVLSGQSGADPGALPGRAAAAAAAADRPAAAQPVPAPERPPLHRPRLHVRPAQSHAPFALPAHLRPATVAGQLHGLLQVRSADLRSPSSPWNASQTYSP